MGTLLTRRPAAGSGDTVRVDTVRVDAATLQWPVWSTTARLVVTDPAQLDAAHRLVHELLADVDAAASRFRTDSEVNAVHAAGGRPVAVSALLAELVAVALDAAARTDGDVDPTIGAALIGLGYDRDLTDLDRDVTDLDRDVTGLLPGGFGRVIVRPAPGWRGVRLTGDVLTLPAGVVLDLGATAKAWTADRAAALIAGQLGTGVLVSLGGDIATAGPAPGGGWQIRVQDGDTEPGCAVALPAGAAIATSSTLHRQWRHGERAVHHILDPRTLAPAPPVWRTVTAAATSCVAANTLTTAAMVRGAAAAGWLDGLGVPARLVRADGAVLGTRSWPTTPRPTTPRPATLQPATPGPDALPPTATRPRTEPLR